MVITKQRWRVLKIDFPIFNYCFFLNIQINHYTIWAPQIPLLSGKRAIVEWNGVQGAQQTCKVDCCDMFWDICSQIDWPTPTQCGHHPAKASISTYLYECCPNNHKHPINNSCTKKQCKRSDKTLDRYVCRLCDVWVGTISLVVYNTTLLIRVR